MDILLKYVDAVLVARAEWHSNILDRGFGGQYTVRFPKNGIPVDHIVYALTPVAYWIVRAHVALIWQTSLQELERN